MKKIISLLLIIAIVCSLGTSIFATTTDYNNGTTITLVGTGTESYNVTVPANLAPGQSDTVTVSGTWGSGKILKVSCPNKVTLTYGTQTIDVGVVFDDIALTGNDFVPVNQNKQISVNNADVLFGTWIGTIMYNVEMVSSTTATYVLEGDGQTYHRMAPSALSFRSTAPLDEFQEVLINDKPLDKSAYTLTEGSTIVTLNVDYLETLDIDDYKITVVSNSGSPSANFEVLTSTKSKQGFYYDQPYHTSLLLYYFVDGELMCDTVEEYAFVLRENGTALFVNPTTGEVTNTDVSFDGNICNITLCDMEISGTFSADGMTFICEYSENFDDYSLKIENFTLNNHAAVSDNEYLYILNASNDTWFVSPINKTQSSYSPVKSNILNKPVVSIGEFAFRNNTNLTSLPYLPESIIEIWGYAFAGCTGLKNVDIPTHITGLGSGVFDGCTGLTEINIPNSLTTLESYIFTNCTNLTSIYLPDSITNISENAFRNCGKLTNIYFDGSIEQWNNILFFDNWNFGCPQITVNCTDGVVTIPSR